ncbi:LytR/AlgR family response regulator transcription factor [Flavobacterium cheniae]|uniref:LytTR family two component transcriptional regulator n=1 Tax=Flavobacterium cheniae TaxID=295428 RepID=A0A562KF91_9FLAO|nr:LytTR family DNA-binding domain-containing protein [Flavobacterium cheniae]TDR21035.1 LytTR family two component transcriptional regulator [Flavobacterium cheniae]TWH94089.1 LytTR family two component transcriptional regulator [Flavobacterium cheniae]
MKAIIIDDEKRARVSLSLLLQEYCPQVTIVAECENLPEGVKAIRKHQPDIVLLDIEMPGHSGLELLDFFDENEVNFSIIFTTAYNEYALKAFKFSAVDYLLKPIIPEELAEAVERVAKQKQRFENFRAFKENLQQETLTKIAVPSGNTLLFLDTDKIMYIKGEGAYSEVFCSDGSKQLVSRNLKNFEDILCSDSRFLRIHKSYIVNFNFVVAFNKSDGVSIELENKAQIPVSPDKAQQILDQIQIIKR